MRILAIETSCDETALALVEASFSPAPTFKILAESLYSQTELHAQYGGVFPMMAKREHNKNLLPLYAALAQKTGGSTIKLSGEALAAVRASADKEPDLVDTIEAAKESFPSVSFDCIAVTVGPGLEPCLWTGINFARTLSIISGKPIVAANHMEGHIYSILAGSAAEAAAPIDFPALALLISGGHTELVHMEGYGSYKIVGETRDDAVGEAFDKVARILGLPYPGGPKLSALAKTAREKNIESPFPIPRPMLHSKDLDFSFSGLKTAALYGAQELGVLSEEQKAGVARGVEDAIVDVLVAKTEKALEDFPAKTLIVGGGVIANAPIRAALTRLSLDRGITFRMPEKELSTDNAVMIALAGAFAFEAGTIADPATLKAQGNLSL